MAENVIFGFLESVNEEPQEAEAVKKRERHPKSKKKGISDIENAFLTVGNGQIVEETDEPEENWMTADNTAADPPPEPKPNKTREVKSEAPRPAPAKPAEKPAERPPAAPKQPVAKPAQEPQKANPGNAAELIKKLNELIIGQTKVMESLDQLKKAAKHTVQREEEDTHYKSVIKSLEDLKAQKEAELLQAEELEKQKEEKSEDFAKVIERLGQQVSEKDAEITRLTEENAKLQADNQKLRKAVIEKILSTKANAGIPALPGTQAMPQIQQQTVRMITQQAVTQEGVINDPNSQQPVQIQRSASISLQQTVPASYRMPTQTQPQIQTQQNAAPNPMWGSEAPPAVDLLAEEQPKKKRGLFGRKK